MWKIRQPGPVSEELFSKIDPIFPHINSSVHISFRDCTTGPTYSTKQLSASSGVGGTWM